MRLKGDLTAYLSFPVAHLQGRYEKDAWCTVGADAKQRSSKGLMRPCAWRGKIRSRTFWLEDEPNRAESAYRDSAHDAIAPTPVPSVAATITRRR
jgi:hypothetical protein